MSRKAIVVALVAVAMAVALGTAPLAGAGTASSDHEVVGYWGGWSADGNRYLVRDIPAGQLTTLIYHSAKIDTRRGTCTLARSLGERIRHSGRRYDATESVDGVADRRGRRILRGNLAQLQKLRDANPHLKILVSIAAGFGSTEFAGVAATSASRKRFVRSCVDLLIRGKVPGKKATPGLFDGIDVDWEFPLDAEQRLDFTRLLAVFRRQLDRVDPDTPLTIATPAWPHANRDFELARIHEHVDWINLMGYDLHGAWDRRTNFLAPLRLAPGLPDDGLTIDKAVDVYLAEGVPPEKLVLGVPFYGRGWRGVRKRERGLGQPTRCGKAAASCPAPHPSHPGVAPYSELAKKYASRRTFHEPVAQQVWTYDRKSRVFWTSESPLTIATKMVYLEGRGLRGAMIWEISQDTSDRDLLTAITDTLGRAGTVARSKARTPG